MKTYSAKPKEIEQRWYVVDAEGQTLGSKVTLSIEQTGPMGAIAAMLWRRLTQRYIELEAESLDKRVTRASAA